MGKAKIKTTGEEIRNSEYVLSVGELMKFIEKNGISPDYKIVYERIEDSYFEKEDNGWAVLSVENNHPMFKDVKHDEKYNDEFIPARTCSIRNDDERGILFIITHY